MKQHRGRFYGLFFYEVQMKIPRLGSKFKVTIQDAIFTVVPLTYEKKAEMGNFTKIVAGREIVDTQKVSHFLIKHSIKSLEGVTDLDGEKYELEFDGDCLTDNCASEIGQMLIASEIQLACMAVSGGHYDKVINPINGETLDGIKVEYIKKKKEDKAVGAEPIEGK